MSNIPDFYKEYSDNPEMFESIRDSIIEAGRIIENQIDQVRDNYTITNTRSYKTIPFQQIDVTDATYSLQDLLMSQPVEIILDIKGLSLEEKINIWNNTADIDKKMQSLDMFEKTIILTNTKDIIVDNYSEKKIRIVDFKMFDASDKRQLTIGVDYYYKGDSIYLLGDFARKTSGLKTVFIEDLAIDINTPYELIGKNVGLNYVDTFTQDEYKDLAEAFTKGAYRGPILQNLNKSFSQISYSEGFTVHDRNTKDPIKKEFWDENSLVPSNKLGLYDFIISLPVSSYYDTDKINAIMKYIRKTKPVDTSFSVSPEMTISDKLTAKIKRADKFKGHITSKPKDIISVKKDSVSALISLLIEKEGMGSESESGTLLDNDFITIDNGYLYDSDNVPASDTIKYSDKFFESKLIMNITDNIYANDLGFSVGINGTLLAASMSDKIKHRDDIITIAHENIENETIFDSTFSIFDNDHQGLRMDTLVNLDSVPSASEIIKYAGDYPFLEVQNKLSDDDFVDRVNGKDSIEIKLINKE